MFEKFNIDKNRYQYFLDLGYSEKEAIVWSLINFNGYYGDPRIKYLLDLYQKESNDRNFIDFIIEEWDKVDLKKLMDERMEERNPGLFKSMIQGVARKESFASNAKAAGMNVMYDAMAVPDAIVAPMGMMMAQECAMEAPMGISPEQIRTDSYENIEEKPERDTVHSPTATFRPTFNTAAAGILLNNIRKGANTRHSIVRTEELLNYLNYLLKSPEVKMFEVTKEMKTVDDKTYLFLGVQGKQVVPTKQNICLLVDVSGSMSSKANNMVETIAAILSKMNNGDVLSLVTYSDEDEVVLNSLKLTEDNLADILHLLFKININGCTNGSAGLNKSYEIISKNKIEDGVNRVIIMTDGDLNFGIHDKDGLKGLIEKQKETGAYFSAIGMGLYNLQDDKLEVLAKNGNGNYFVVNSLEDIKKTIIDKYDSLVYPIAKNVKAQVEFNPKKIKTWKLVGYENRMLNHEDFRNDEVIAEPFGSGSYFVALFEIELNEDKKVTSDLKYQEIKTTNIDELGTLYVRYEDAVDGEIKEEEFPIECDLKATDNIDKAIGIAEIAEKLRDNNVDNLTKEKLLKILK